MPFHRTTDHDEIRSWVEQHGGRPSALRTIDGALGVVRINYSTDSGKLQPISWDEFFNTFEERRLAFVYEDQVPSGAEERMTKLVNRGS